MNAANRFDTDDRRWAAAQARDPAAAHAFYICVRTTGVYCLATCAARPLRKNVFFVETRAEAETAGMRACKRCRPDAIGEQTQLSSTAAAIRPDA